MEGYDFGIRHRIMVLGDFTYAEDWDNSGYVANMYAIYPQHGVIFNAPMVAMVFENEKIGRRLFSEHFMKWAEGSKNGDAIEIVFVEWNDGSYTMALAPDSDLLIERIYPDIDNYEFQILPMIRVKSMDFPRKSEYFTNFKHMAKTNPIIFMPTNKNLEIFEDLIIVKRKIVFLNEGDVSENSLGKIALGRHNDAEELPESPIPIEDYSEIVIRRMRLIKKYFPLTIERLRISKEYSQIQSLLISEGYKDWQIEQASCNLVLSHSMLKTYHFKKSKDELSDSFHKANEGLVKDLLDDYIEDPSVSGVLEIVMSINAVKKQIMLDSLDLLETYGIKPLSKNTPLNVQKKMNKYKLL